MHYILDGHEPVPCEDIYIWAEWFADINNRRVASDTIGESEISTVCLGLDHFFIHAREHVPILFETMVFGGELDGYTRRYATWGEAEAGHKEIIALVRNSE